MLDDDKPLEDIASWSKAQNVQLVAFRDIRKALKNKMLKTERKESTRLVQKEIEKQRLIREEMATERIREQQVIEAATARKIQLEKEWLEHKMQLQKEEKHLSSIPVAGPSTAPQVVKLQRLSNYAILRRLQRLAKILESIHSGS